MSAAIEKQDLVLFEAIEQANCLQCESVIPPHQIQKRLERSTGLEPTRQVVQAWCAHCRRLYECTRELRDGQWRVVVVTVVTSPRKLESFHRRLDFLQGSRRLKTA